MTRELVPFTHEDTPIRRLAGSGHMFRRVISCCLALAFLASCGPSHHYHLRVDGRQPERSQLCRRPSDHDAEDEDCQPLEGQRLEAPSQITVSVDHAVSGEAYELSLENTVQGTGAQAANAALSQFIGRIAGFANLSVNNILGDESSKEGTNAAREQLEDVMRGLPETLRREANRAVGDALEQTRGASDEQVVRAVLARFVRDETDARAAAVTAGHASPSPDQIRAHRLVLRSQLNTARRDLFRQSPVPPPRTIVLDEAAYVDLLRLAPGLTADEVAAFVVSWCERQSWGHIGQGGGQQDVAAIVTAPPSTDAAAIAEAIGLTPARLEATLTGMADGDTNALIERRLGEAAAERAAGRVPTGRVAVVEYLRLAATLDRQLDRCDQNVAALLRNEIPGLTSDAELRRVRSEITALRSTTQGAAASYRAYIQPRVTEIARARMRAIAEDQRVVFASYPLRPGRLNVGVRRAGRSLLSTELQVDEPPWLVVSIGGVMTFCDGCIGGTAVVTDPPTDPTASGAALTRRAVARSDSVAGAPALSVHVSLLHFQRSHFGLMVGYPLGDATGTALNALVGASYRHTIGLQIGAGFQLFSRRTFREGVTPPVDLTTGPNATLSLDDLTEETPALAGFVFIGLSNDLLTLF